MTAGRSIDYDALTQDALRGIVRAALQLIVKEGLPGEHHFYISFLTQAPGVVLSKRLKEKYPHEMTIVLQHRFWDLLVSEERFEVKLTFDGVPERLVVPYGAIKVFIDPSVHFGLQFEDPSEKAQSAPRRTLTADQAFDTAEAPAGSPRAALTKKPRPQRKTKAEKDNAEASERPRAEPQPPQPEPASAARPKQADMAEESNASGDASGAKILSLDQFRKK